MERTSVLIFPLMIRSQIHERSISLRFLGIILRGLRLEVSEYNVYITYQFQTSFVQGVGRVKSGSRGGSENQGGKLLRLLSQLRPRIRPLEKSSGFSPKENPVVDIRGSPDC